MKQINFLILAGTLLFSSCRKYAPEPYQSPREEQTTYHLNMKIDSFTTVNGTSYGVSSGGTTIVFRYNNQWGTSDDIFDNEYYASVWFPVSPELTRFSYTDGQLAEHLCHFTGGGAWGGYGDELLEKGKISGSKNADGTWDVAIDVTLKGIDQRLKTSHIVKYATFTEGNF